MAKLILEILPDVDPLPPFEGNDTVRFYTNVPRYIGPINTKDKLEDFVEGNGEPFEKIAARIRKSLPGKGWVLFPVRGYIHSGVALSLGTGYPFDCPWDSGWAGVLAFQGDGKRGNLRARKSAEAIIETLNQWFSGDVWGYAIKDENDNTIDSVWGFYGREDAEQEANQALKAAQEQEDKEAASYANSN